MVTLKLQTRITKGNSEGIGFIRIPILQRKKIEIDENFRVTIKNVKTDEVFYGRIKNYSGLGMYVPKNITNKFSNKTFQIILEKINGFHTKIGDHGQVYIPKSISGELLLKNNDIVLIKATINGEEKEKFCLVKFRKYVKNECFVSFYTRYSGRSAIFKIIKKIERTAYRNELLPKLDDIVYGKIDEENIILYHGNKVPIMVNNNINVDDFACYLGHYFADGTKRGNSWGLCISTFDQAKKFLAMHKKLIPDAKLDIYISFTNREFNQKIKNSLICMWKKKTGIKINKIQFHKTEASYSPNRNRFGTIVLKEHRKLTQIYYNMLVDYILEKIEKKKNNKIAIDFICGVLEGDGSPSSRRDGNIIISTNKNEVKALERVLPFTNLQYKVYRERKTNKIYIRLGSLGVLKNIPIIKDKLFRHYPKRRKRFIERFHNVGAVKFILGEQKHAAGWVKSYLKENGILDEKYSLTLHGRKINKYLKEMIEESKSIKVK